MAAVDKAGCVSDVLLRTVFLYHVFEYHVSLQVFTTQACMCTSLVTSVDLGHVYGSTQCLSARCFAFRLARSSVLPSHSPTLGEVFAQPLLDGRCSHVFNIITYLI